MIVLGEKNGNVNILHIIIGDETEFQLDLSGQSVMDISEYIKVQEGEKYVIVLNRCSSEEQVIQELNYRKSKIETKEALKQYLENQDEHPHTKSTSKKKIDKTSKLKCPECKSENSTGTVDGIVQPCAKCKEINDGLKKHNIPQIPNAKDLESIKDKLIGKKKWNLFNKKDPDETKDNDGESHS